MTEQPETPTGDTEMTKPPTRIEWDVQGCTVRLCEDGVELWRPPVRGLEQGELNEILAVIQAAKSAQALGEVEIPRAPTQEEVGEMSYGLQRQYAYLKSLRAIKQLSEDDASGGLS